MIHRVGVTPCDAGPGAMGCADLPGWEACPDVRCTCNRIWFHAVAVPAGCIHITDTETGEGWFEMPVTTEQGRYEYQSMLHCFAYEPTEYEAVTALTWGYPQTSIPSPDTNGLWEWGMNAFGLGPDSNPYADTVITCKTKDATVDLTNGDCRTWQWESTTVGTVRATAIWLEFLVGGNDPAHLWIELVHIEGTTRDYYVPTYNGTIIAIPDVIQVSCVGGVGFGGLIDVVDNPDHITATIPVGSEEWDGKLHAWRGLFVMPWGEYGVAYMMQPYSALGLVFKRSIRLRNGLYWTVGTGYDDAGHFMFLMDYDTLLAQPMWRFGLGSIYGGGISGLNGYAKRGAYWNGQMPAMGIALPFVNLPMYVTIGEVPL